MPTQFIHHRDQQTSLWDFGWFDTSEFRAEGDLGHGSPLEVVTGFVTSPIFSRSYWSADDPWGGCPGQHGPFVHAKMDATWLTPLSAAELLARLEAARSSEEFSSPPETDQWEHVESWSHGRIEAGDALFALDAPEKPGVRHDMQLWSIFVEVLTLSRDARTLHVAVIGYD